MEKILKTMPFEIIINYDQIKHFDYHIPLFCLPRILKTDLTNIPIFEQYIFPEIEPWNEKLSEYKIKIGIAWRGNPEHDNDHNRSLPVEKFAEILKDAPKDITFFGLQKNVTEKERTALSQYNNFVDLCDDLHNFIDTGNIVVNLDLIISVDTSVVHLSGACGRNTWVLLPFAPDWRWLLEREDSPWYPTLRLFRQTAPGGNWDGVIQQIKENLICPE